MNNEGNVQTINLLVSITNDHPGKGNGLCPSVITATVIQLNRSDLVGLDSFYC